MPPSQLKRLKASLRESGVVSQQKSKKQQRQAGKSGALKDSRAQKNAALQSIRSQFNPFEVKPAGRSKHEFVSNKTVGGRVGKPAIARPGVTKGHGEETRRKTLLVEMQRRKKVGGITDRRFGENDATMTPEEKALQRFVTEKQRGSKKGAMFDLEDGEEEGDLTHFGKALSFESPSKVDDFNEADLHGPDEDVDNFKDAERPNKRRRLSDSDASDKEATDAEKGGPSERQKTKNEVMKELISKSKLHKYERQQAKEDDDDLRAELDKGLPDLFALIRGSSAPVPKPAEVPVVPGQNGAMNPDRVAMLNGKERSKADKEYDQRLRQMAMEQRAKPTEKTLTEDERTQQEARRLKDLEERRLRRMRGDQGECESEIGANGVEMNGEPRGDEDEYEDAFGLGSGLVGQSTKEELSVEDEDNFVIDDDLIASVSEQELSSDDDDADMSDDKYENEGHDDDTEFVHGLLSKDDTGREGLSATGANATTEVKVPKTKLAYTYPCPRTHEELLGITKDVPLGDLPTVVQRIRALYQPQLASENKAKLGVFATVLVDHISYMANQPDHPPFMVLEALIRHIHSLAKTFPEEVGRTFRAQLKSIHEERPTAPTPGDLVLLTAIGSIFPTSDHFHQVVIAAMLCMSRYLGQKIPSSLSDFATGTYISTLCLHYQRLSKRCLPEVINYVLNAMYALMPAKSKHFPPTFPRHNLAENIRINALSSGSIEDIPDATRRLDFWDVVSSESFSDGVELGLKYTLLSTQFSLVENMTDLWADKSAFCEMLGPIYTALRFLADNTFREKLELSTVRTQALDVCHKVRKLLKESLEGRQPLRVHNHRPLAIKTSIPKFEESYNPDKHYDPDRDRAEFSKLKAEHKKERKGALRELRKDANFMARENMREKKERDNAYEKKYKRLVAEIQGEEGREAKLYDREKKSRKGKK